MAIKRTIGPVSARGGATGTWGRKGSGGGATGSYHRADSGEFRKTLKTVFGFMKRLRGKRKKRHSIVAGVRG